MADPLRIVVLANRDIESCVALNLLHRALGARIAAVFLSEHVGGRATPSPLLEPLAAVGRVFFAQQALSGVERLASDGGYLTFVEFERVHGTPIRVLESARTATALDALCAPAADLFLSVRFGHILGGDAIGIPRLGVLNLHSGLLPQYRGVLATFRALCNGDDEIGCTLHFIDSPKIDAGEILATRRIPVDRTRSLLWHILALYPPGMEAMAHAVLAIEQGHGPAGVPQDSAAGAYFSFPSEAEVESFLAAGWRLVDREDLDALERLFTVAAYRALPSAPNLRS